MDPCRNIDLRIYKAGELFLRTMLAGVVDPSQDDIESQGNSQQQQQQEKQQHLFIPTRNKNRSAMRTCMAYRLYL